MNSIVFIDTEVNPQNNRLLDMGAVKPDNSKFHSNSQSSFSSFISGSDFICGHNIIAHDLKYIAGLITDKTNISIIDTLCLSPLLFPSRPYHALLKDDKLQSDELNNPLNDSIKAMELFFDEVNAFEQLSSNLKAIYFSLLGKQAQFSGFFKYVEFSLNIDVEITIKNEFSGKMCGNAVLSGIIENYPIELAYCLALMSAQDRFSITPPWVCKNHPVVENVMKLLRNTSCKKCVYCLSAFDVHLRLKDIFGYEEFRKYNGEPLQENAAEAAVHNRSLLAIFPTGGGKSITFQLPALIMGEAARGLTVVISPLQSLMKDQVDNLSEQGIADAVTINGLLNAIERAEALERVESGLASILYISPEALRSKTIEKVLLSRNVIRFVIDEAHCFSSWGQDFRVDYLYIGDFIKNLQKMKNLGDKIPVSCFTATAKQKVISDIRDYFKQKLDVELELYATNATRDNLRYKVLYKETDDEKYTTLRNIIEQWDCPTIVYVSRTKRTVEIAKKLTEDGFQARPFNGKMAPSEKIANQEDFISGKAQIIVATSAFGMGVDKKDVKLVVHFDISDSLENYVQEAGRAGRDQSIQAECYILFNDNDLDKHFILLNQTKLSISEIQQVWKAIKDLTRTRNVVRRSPLEIARAAGWDDTVHDVETRVKTAISALETAGYIKRGKNVPRIYATSILAKNMGEASAIINGSRRFNEAQKLNASRIIKLLISSRSVARAGNDEAESRIDYISDLLGLSKKDVIALVNLMREEGLLADSQDLTAHIRRADNQNKSLAVLQRYARLEEFLISIIADGNTCVNLKEINEQAEKADIKGSSVKSIRTLLYYWTIKSYIRKSLNTSEKRVDIIPEMDLGLLENKYEKRIDLARFIVKHLYDRSFDEPFPKKEEIPVQFSVLELKNAYADEIRLSKCPAETTFEDVEDALLYLSKIDSLNLEGGFLVLYNAMEIQRLELDNKIRYKNEDYKHLNEYYKQKIQQIHIVGEYANMMVRDYNAALQFVRDYFQMNYKQFIAKYFKGTRVEEIGRNITPEKYKQLFDGLSSSQKEIIDDDKSKYIVVAAGPGSGKTRVLVHKLASLYQLEDVKHEQLLMLTFSRSAATEFKKRLVELIGNAANFIEIKTFHSYCFDLLGKIGSLENADEIVERATEMIKNSEVEIGRITKTVVVIDEAQDMDKNEFALIKAFIDRNEEMRVIAVGDDDQNIYAFRGSSSEYLKSFIRDNNAKVYELLENYRSKADIVGFANAFSGRISQRIKSNPIRAVQEGNGMVKLIKHRSRNLETPVVSNIKASYKGGSVCVLTSTNEEALRVTGLLVKEGFKAKLIQSNEGFNLYNLAELRYFMKIINRKATSAVISDEVWKEAKDSLRSTYGQSECLSNCFSLLNEFEQTNGKKYKTDLEIFIRESQFEDFCNGGQDEIVVSTIHKSKGREFDSVYMLMNNVSYTDDESKRTIYVGLTRAKDGLYIHYNNDCFDGFKDLGQEISVDNVEYPEPEEIVIQLSHKDVFLGFFKDKREIIRKLQSGYALTLKGNSLYTEGSAGAHKVLIFSKKFQERMIALQSKGYAPCKAKIRFVVAWKGEGEEHEIPILLPDIYFRKNKRTNRGI